MTYGVSNGIATDDVTCPPPKKWCKAVRSAILAIAWLLVKSHALTGACMSLQLNHYNRGDAGDEVERMTLLQRCRKRAAEEDRTLRQIFDDACRSSDAGTSVSFATVESSV